MSKAIDELVCKLRELLAASTDDVIAKMRTATEEMLGPEEHECWFEYSHFNCDDGIWIMCKCGDGYAVPLPRTNAMYNAMRHLGARPHDVSVLLEYAARRAAGNPDYVRPYYATKFRAAAAAMRKSASKSE